MAAGLALPLALPGVAQAASGALDGTFGTGGKVTTDFAGDMDEAHGVVVQADGKFVAAGVAKTSRSQDFALARYNPNGSLDGTFGTGGKVTTDFNGGDDAAFAVALQSDGKIVAAGAAKASYRSQDFALARYNPNGSLDATFGNGGKVTTDFNGDDDAAHGVLVQSDGKIVAAGVAKTSRSQDFALARYNPNGSLDGTFGTGGKVTTDFAGDDDAAFAVALQPDGKIVAAGGAKASYRSQDFALARYNPNGGLDTTFGTGGKVTTDFAGDTDEAHGVVVQLDGKIVAAGVANTSRAQDFALARYNPDGGLDTTFGTGGKVTTDFAGGDDAAFAVALQPDGKIVAAGGADAGGSRSSYRGSGEDFALARYLG